MSSVEEAASVPSSSADRVRAWWDLAKPSVVIMVLGTTAVGYYLGLEAGPDWAVLFHVLASTGLAAGGTMSLNQYIERDLDSRMHRTRSRPLPSGKIGAPEALVHGVLLVVVGLAYQFVAVGGLATAVTASTTVTYLGLYTPLKRVTPFCSLIGAVPGALPPVTGWAAARGSLDVGAWILFAILFLWQLPHSLAIARLYRDDYARAGIRLLPVIDPEGPSTGHQIVLNSAGLLTVALLPTLIGVSGPIYFVVALALGIWLLERSIRLARSKTLVDARRLLMASLIYLPILLGAMALDKVTG